MAAAAAVLFLNGSARTIVTVFLRPAFVASKTVSSLRIINNIYNIRCACVYTVYTHFYCRLYFFFHFGFKFNCTAMNHDYFSYTHTHKHTSLIYLYLYYAYRYTRGPRHIHNIIYCVYMYIHSRHGISVNEKS